MVCSRHQYDNMFDLHIFIHVLCTLLIYKAIPCSSMFSVRGSVFFGIHFENKKNNNMLEFANFQIGRFCLPGLTLYIEKTWNGLMYMFIAVKQASQHLVACIVNVVLHLLYMSVKTILCCSVSMRARCSLFGCNESIKDLYTASCLRLLPKSCSRI